MKTFLAFCGVVALIAVGFLLCRFGVLDPVFERLAEIF